MAKIISFFNHKGGVGKTTLAYNVAWGLSKQGKKVLMLDADPQANLTEITVANSDLYDLGDLDLLSTYNSSFFEENNIFQYLRPFTELGGEAQKEIHFFEKKENLSLLSGSIRLAELDENISLSLAGIAGLRRIPELIYGSLQQIAQEFDYVIIDLSPALSATNQLLVELSDYFLIPVNPSIFSSQALRNLLDIFRLWNRKMTLFDFFGNSSIKELPKMLGIVCQNYRPFSRKNEENTKSAKRFQERFEELNTYATNLASELNSFGMAINRTEFEKLFSNSTPYRIANIPDYNQLAMVSESEKKPVLGITRQMLNKTEYKLGTDYYSQKLDDFRDECGKIVDGLLRLD